MNSQTHEYDKIIKENIEAMIPSLMSKVLGIKEVASEEIPDDMQHTIERKPDLLKKITDDLGRTFILHIEFQVADETKMIYRMMEYFAMLWRKYELPVRQYVIYMSEKPPKMRTELYDDLVFYQYHLVPLIGVNYLSFMDSEVPEEIILAILSNFQNENPDIVVAQILERLEEKTKNGLDLQRFFKQIRILSKLRKLQPTIDKIMDNITHLFEEETDYLYQKAIKKTQKQMVIDLLTKTDFSIEKIAELARVSVEQALEIKQELDNAQNKP